VGPRAYDERMGLFSRDKAPEPLASPSKPVVQIPAQLLWLVDAPLFIDGEQIDAFYDAVLRPDYEMTSMTLSNGITRTTSLGGQATVGAALPWFGKAQIQATAGYSGARDKSTETALAPITNSYRHLLAMALHYAGGDSAERLLTYEADSQESASNEPWLKEDFIETSPRALVFLNLPKSTELLPAALELDNGDVVVLADTIEDRLRERGETPEPFPGPGASVEASNEYFRWLMTHYDNQLALDAIEDAAKAHKIAWIDFNVPLDRSGTVFLHLHMVGREQFDTGVFAYNFTRRGFTHGLRVVGTLKTGPDLNVLAVFER
jgi:hypothetical protein